MLYNIFCITIPCSNFLHYKKTVGSAYTTFHSDNEKFYPGKIFHRDWHIKTFQLSCKNWATSYISNHSHTMCTVGFTKITTSGQSNLTTGRISAAHGHFNHTRHVVPMCTRCNTSFPGPIWVHNPNSISIDSAIFAQLTGVSSDMSAHVFSPKNYPFSWGDLDPHLTHGSLK